MNEKLTKILEEVEKYEREEEKEQNKYEEDYKKKKLLLKYDLHTIEKLTNLEEYTRIKEYDKTIGFKYDKFYPYMKEGNKEYSFIRKSEQGNFIMAFEKLTDEEYLKFKKYDKMLGKKSEGDGSGYKAFAWVFIILSLMIFGPLMFFVGGWFMLPLLAMMVIPLILFSLSELTNATNEIKEEIGMK